MGSDLFVIEERRQLAKFYSGLLFLVIYSCMIKYLYVADRPRIPVDCSAFLKGDGVRDGVNDPKLWTPELLLSKGNVN